MSYYPPGVHGLAHSEARHDPLTPLVPSVRMPIHLFADESGGTDPGRKVFLVSVLAISKIGVRRVFRQFRRKYTPLYEEVKGSSLSTDQRCLLLSLAWEDHAAHGALVVYDRNNLAGAWAAAEVDEWRLHTQGVVDGVRWLLGQVKPTDIQDLTIDSGRYPRRLQSQQLALLRTALLPVLPHLRERIWFDASHNHPGLQLADVLANAASRKATRSENVVPSAVQVLPPNLVALGAPEWLLKFQGFLSPPPLSQQRERPPA